MARWIIAAALGLAACHVEDPCVRLRAELCAGTGAACDAVEVWLDSELVGRAGDPLTGARRQRACRLILDDADALSGFVEKAGAELPQRTRM